MVECVENRSLRWGESTTCSTTCSNGTLDFKGAMSCYVQLSTSCTNCSVCIAHLNISLIKKLLIQEHFIQYSITCQ